MRRTSPKTERLILREVKPLVTAAGGRCWVELGRGGGHNHLCIEIGKIVRHTPIAGTPREDDNAVKMKTADVKRILREMTGHG